MTYYIKCNELAGRAAGAAAKHRRRFPDGSWCLWQADLAVFGKPWEIDEICARIGAVKLTPSQAKDEFDGRARVQLPVPADELFRMPEEGAEA